MTRISRFTRLSTRNSLIPGPAWACASSPLHRAYYVLDIRIEDQNHIRAADRKTASDDIWPAPVNAGHQPDDGSFHQVVDPEMAVHVRPHAGRIGPWCHRAHVCAGNRNTIDAHQLTLDETIGLGDRNGRDASLLAGLDADIVDLGDGVPLCRDRHHVAEVGIE